MSAYDSDSPRRSGYDSDSPRRMSGYETDSPRFGLGPFALPSPRYAKDPTAILEADQLRFWVLLFAGMTAIYGLVTVSALLQNEVPERRVVTDSVRLAVGGYANGTEWPITIVGVMGIFAGYFGVVGCYDRRGSEVKTFAWYLVIRAIVTGAIFVVDYMDLMKCEVWLSTIDSVLNYRPDMNLLARQGGCTQTRNWYTFFWIWDFLINCIAYYITTRYAAQLTKQKYKAIAKAEANAPAGYGAIEPIQP